MKQRAVFIWYVKAQHMRKLEEQQQHQQRAEEETKAGLAAAALLPSFSSFSAGAVSSSLSWAVGAGKWVKRQVDRAVAPPRRPKSPSYYLEYC